MYAKFVKRFLDVILSAAAMIVLSPLLIIIAIAVRIQMGKPVLFSQERIGKDETIFISTKFRTVRVHKECCYFAA